ncbi:MAG TPA: response regulator, partial [Nevskiaceae bacterium]|nr:response regulator [Nevskiaceae bacterium]
LAWLLDSVAVPNRPFNDTQAFLAALDGFEDPACVVLDLRMPGASGIEVMERLQQRRPDLPIIFLSAHGDVPSAVRAMKLGAVDFLQKPFNPQQFLDCVNRATALARTRHAEWLKRQDYGNSVARLSPREREVLDRILEGASSKEIARSLDISPKTVDVHRANVLRKLNAVSARELATRFRDRGMTRDTA